MQNSQGFLSGIMVAAMAVLISSISLEVTAGSKGDSGRGEVSQGVVNIDTATAAELTRLPGIGPSKAEAIVTYRAKHEFKKVEELARIKGIGRKTVRKLRPYLAVSGATTLKKRVGNAK